MSKAVEAQILGLPKGSPLVFWLDEVDEFMDEIDGLREE